MAANEAIQFHDPSGKYKVRYQGAYPGIEVLVSHGDGLVSEPGAMTTMHNDVSLKAQMLNKSTGQTCLACCCAGESFFANYYQPKDHVPPGYGLDVFITPSGPGEVMLLHMNNEEWLIQSGSFLCADSSLTIGATAQGRDCADMCKKGCCSGEGFFLLKVTGTGRLCLDAYGSILRYDLQPGEQRVIDNGQILCWTSGMDYDINFAVPGNMCQSYLSGEGFVCTFTGPGTVYCHTRSWQGLADAIAPHLPTQASNENGDGGGGGD